jgi:hypothetical protein
MTGYRESDRLVICNKTSPDFIVPFTMLDCTGFADKHRPDWDQMEKLAINLQPVRISSRTAGFSGIAASVAVSNADEDEADAEVARGR